MTLFCYVVSGTWKVVITCYHACQNDCYTAHHSNTNTNKDKNTNQWKICILHCWPVLLDPQICWARPMPFVVQITIELLSFGILGFWISSKYFLQNTFCSCNADCRQMLTGLNCAALARQIMICYCCAFECLISWYWIAPSFFTPVSPLSTRASQGSLRKWKRQKKSDFKDSCDYVFRLTPRSSESEKKLIHRRVFWKRCQLLRQFQDCLLIPREAFWG